MQNVDQSNETFDRALEECEKFKNALVTELGGMPIASERSRLASLFLCIALDHFRSITHLLDDGRYVASAFALVRPVAEACFRSVWVAQFASDDEIKAKLKNEKSEYPSMKKVSHLIVKRFGTEDQFTKTIAEDYDVLCGYVHTGLRQLKSKATASRTKEFPYKKALAMLSTSAFYLWLGAFQFAMSIHKGEALLRIDKAHNELSKGIDALIEIPTIWVN